MFIDDSDKPAARVGVLRALRHLIVFQIKLGADALRDIVLSPLSVLVFLIDALRRPDLEDSLYLRLMLLGRRTDAMINLFDQHKDAGAYTIDEAVDELQRQIQRRDGERGGK
jgi:hypothetical protein